MQPSRMPVLVSGASFACNFVRGSYLEVRVTTSATGNRATATAVPASLFLSCECRQGSFNGFGLNHADQRGGSRHGEKKTFLVLPSRGGIPFSIVLKMTSYRENGRISGNNLVVWIMFRTWMEIGEENYYLRVTG